MASLIADNAWNAGIVLGAWQSAWPDLASVEAVVQHDGVELDRGHGRDVLGHPIHALTWLAKSEGWNTHYTKFGPQGFERDLPSTLASASLAQLGMWVPLTVVFGCVVGTLFARRRAA